MHKILFIGDSQVAADRNQAKSSDDLGQGFVAQLEEIWREEGLPYTAINKAYKGAQFKDIWSDLRPNLDQLDAIDGLVIGAGINDIYFHRQLTKGEWQNYLGNWPKDFNRLLDQVQSHFAPKFILFLDVTAGFEDPLLQERLLDFQIMFRQCLGKQAHFLSFAQVFESQPSKYFREDHIHFSPSGHHYLSQKIKGKLEQIRG